MKTSPPLPIPKDVRIVISFNAAQPASLQARFDWHVIDEIADFLIKRCEPTLFEDTTAQVHVAHAFQRGKALGLRKKPALKQFAFLAVETSLQALTAPKIEAALTQPCLVADAARDEIMQVLAPSCAEQGINAVRDSAQTDAGVTTDYCATGKDPNYRDKGKKAKERRDEWQRRHQEMREDRFSLFQNHRTFANAHPIHGS